MCLPTAAVIWDFLKNLDEASNFGDVLVLNSNSDLENNRTFGKASLENRSHEIYCCLRLWKSLDGGNAPATGLDWVLPCMLSTA
jgi:hypothetical protein